MASTMRFDKWENPTGTRSLDIANATPGIVPILPTSVTLGSGSSTTSTLGTVSFTGASGISLNNVFTSAYSSYRIIVNVTGASGSNISTYVRLRSAGSDNTSAVYSFAYPLTNNAGTLSGFVGSGSSVWELGRITSGYYAAFVIDMLSPQVNSWTQFTQTTFFHTGSNFLGGAGGGWHSNNYQADGLTLFPGSGTFNGTITVYGYNG